MSNAGKFVIVGTQRTGSSALAEAIGLHPRIACGWEWTQYTFPHRKIEAAKRALNFDFSGLSAKHQERMQSVLNEKKRWIGFKRLFRSSDMWLIHPRYSPASFVDRLESHIKWWAKDSDIRIIHIVRSDHLSWLKSKALADASGLYSGGAYPENLRLSIEIAAARRRLRAKAWIDARMASLNGTNPYYRIRYEDFLSDNRSMTMAIVEFLGCDPREMPPQILRHQPQSRPADTAAITNLDEVKMAIESMAEELGS